MVQFCQYGLETRPRAAGAHCHELLAALITCQSVSQRLGKVAASVKAGALVESLERRIAKQPDRAADARSYMAQQRGCLALVAVAGRHQKTSQPIPSIHRLEAQARDYLGVTNHPCLMARAHLHATVVVAVKARSQGMGIIGKQFAADEIGHGPATE